MRKNKVSKKWSPLSTTMQIANAKVRQARRPSKTPTQMLNAIASNPNTWCPSSCVFVAPFNFKHPHPNQWIAWRFELVSSHLSYRWFVRGIANSKPPVIKFNQNILKYPNPKRKMREKKIPSLFARKQINNGRSPCSQAHVINLANRRVIPIHTELVCISLVSNCSKLLLRMFVSNNARQR